MKIKEILDFFKKRNTKKTGIIDCLKVEKIAEKKEMITLFDYIADIPKKQKEEARKKYLNKFS